MECAQETMTVVTPGSQDANGLLSARPASGCLPPIREALHLSHTFLQPITRCTQCVFSPLNNFPPFNFGLSRMILLIFREHPRMARAGALSIRH